MTFIGPCIACQYGRHDEHVEVPKPGWPGVIGGRVECHCKGECRDPQAEFERKVRALEALYPSGEGDG